MTLQSSKCVSPRPVRNYRYVDDDDGAFSHEASFETDHERKFSKQTRRVRASEARLIMGGDCEVNECRQSSINLKRRFGQRWHRSPENNRQPAR